MKKIAVLSFLFFLSISVYSQDYLINFAGIGGSASIDNVKVENLTQGTSLTFNGTDILNLKGVLTNINTIYENTEKTIKVYPNPSTDYTTIEFIATAPGNALISVYNQLGGEMIQMRTNLQKGIYSYQISGLGGGVYTIQIKSETFSYSGKIISQQKSSRIAIINYKSFTENSKPENKLKSTSATIQMQYTTGDRLKFTGISGNYSTVLTDIPAESKNFTFNLIACTDGDNGGYPIVIIGNQTWMAENLKTTHYSNGTAIPLVNNNLSWDALTATDKAYCWYNDDVANKATYGALYTWAAAMNGAASSTVNPSGIQGVCPTGWHLPSGAEWWELEKYLADNGYNYDGTTGGGSAKIAKSLASTSGWSSSSNTGAVGNTDYPAYRNKSGFTALPCGFRNYMGSFGNIGNYGHWWSATEFSTPYTGFQDMFYGDSDVRARFGNKELGFSVRCVRD